MAGVHGPGDPDRIAALTDAAVTSLLAAGADGEQAPAIAADLAARYAEPHRRYHGLAHVAELLALLGDVPLDHRAAVELAVWYHDAVYDPSSATNEADSAALARRQLGDAAVPSAVIDEVAALVAATATHQVHDAEPPPDLGAFLDADLAVLGRSPEGYEAYRAAVRAEYAHVPEDLWRAGRRRVLADLLDHPALFRTPAFAERFEAAARRNLAAEIAALDRSAQP